MYIFDLSRFGAFDFALFLLYAKQEDAGAVFLHLARFAAFDVAAVPLGETPAVINDFCAQLRVRLDELGVGTPPTADDRPTIRPILELGMDGELRPIGRATNTGPLTRHRRSKAKRATEAAARRLIDQALGESGAGENG